MKALVAGADAANQQTLTALLEKEGLHVTSATTGTEVWEFIHDAREPLLVIVEETIPGQPVLEICRETRRQNSQPPVYFIILSQRETVVDNMAAMDAGADDYLGRSAGRNLLMARIKVAQRWLANQSDIATHLATAQAELSRTRDREQKLKNILLKKESEVQILAATVKSLQAPHPVAVKPAKPPPVPVAKPVTPTPAAKPSAPPDSQSLNLISKLERELNQR